MEKYETVGFDLENGEVSDDENCSISIPKQVQQFYMEIPT
jgi:hypothetical protein